MSTSATPHEPKFSDFPLLETIQQDIISAGWEKPTPIQAMCISPAIEGKDIIGLAQTGTGKTAAFALPIIHRLANKMELAALVLAPTRELAHQITDMFRLLGQSSGIRVACVVGGTPTRDDMKALHSWPNVLVATPGRLIDHLEQGTVSLTEIEVLAVDEADRMHDMGFIPQIRRILEAVPPARQTMMFTATMPPDVERIARRNMKDPVRIQAGRNSAPAERAQQQLFDVHDDDKIPLLLQLLDKTEGRVLIFVRTKLGVERLARAIHRDYPNVGKLHGDREQAQRDAAMLGFREGSHRIMIATDIAARGLDVADIEHVINYDFPRAAEDYVHRIGRTARVAASGLATSFVTRMDRRGVAEVQRLTGEKLNIVPFGRAASAPASEEDDREPRRSHGSRGGSRHGGRRPSAHAAPHHAAAHAATPHAAPHAAKHEAPPAPAADGGAPGEGGPKRRRRRRGGKGRSKSGAAGASHQAGAPGEAHAPHGEHKPAEHAHHKPEHKAAEHKPHAEHKAEHPKGDHGHHEKQS